MRAHVIRPGEYLTKIAARLGLDPDALWNHPKNAALKARRQHRDVLLAGDVLYIPDDAKRTGLPVANGAINRFTGKIPKVKMSLVLRDGPRALANEAYKITGAGAPIEGTTDGSGRLTFEVPLSAREAHIALPKRGLHFPIMIGDMDPIDEPTGIKGRLANLGFYIPPAGAADGDEATAVRRAIEGFQRANGLEVNGDADATTRERLRAAYGC